MKAKKQTPQTVGAEMISLRFQGEIKDYKKVKKKKVSWLK